MQYSSVAEMAKKWQLSERSVRNYCAQGRVQGAELHGRVWSIPETAVKPERVNKNKQSERSLLNVLQEEKASRYAGGIYHKTQIELTYNSNHMEGSRHTALPEEVSEQMRALLARYNAKKSKTLKDILDFHVRFERIHPFQDGNGRVGRLIMFKECLKYNIVPFIIEDNLKMFYYRGLKEWGKENGYLTDTCLAAQDRYKEYLDYFRIEYD